MLHPRIIPCLLIQDGGLVKTVRFGNEIYLGDPINAVKIFNEKEVDEIIILDISATPNNLPPNLSLIEEIAGECFMPVAYGGGIRNIKDAKNILSLGVEKIIINTVAASNYQFVTELVEMIGSQSVIVSMDVKKTIFGGYKVLIESGKKAINHPPIEYAVLMQSLGVGELFVNSIDRDGTMQGYDVNLIREISEIVDIPVIACGGAGTLDHLSEVLKKGKASAAAAASIFVFQGKHKAVLITYPNSEQLMKLSS